ncbi:UPF0721 transmembrane protein [Tepiditoga spiralis]|uniref:Probable membrane transporter protein n=1 Tax=Tepiditoga spiralis TaxID=2108365 RepID=A0A7G1G7V8_9BACT|nr:UPF0721 transmembrane protein [Tepiditoga spiralis]
MLILTLFGIPISQAATAGQFILFSAAFAAMIIFHKKKVVIWSLAFLIGGLSATSAFLGGYFSHFFTPVTLKLTFSVLLIISGIIMLIPVAEKNITSKNKKIGYWTIKSKDNNYLINLWLIIPITILIGFTSGMVGVSGGSFLVPLMVLGCSVPMYVAVGTASPLIMVTAFTGFLGHLFQGDFNAVLSISLAIIAIFGGVIGGKLALKSRPKNLKKIFAYTNWLAAVLMLGNIFLR